MREIIVGRQLARVEQRLDRLETFVQQPHISEDDVLCRVETVEAQFEAVRDHMQHQVDQMRLEFGGEVANRRQEVHRLAEQIQLAAQARNEERAQAESVAVLEQRVGQWLGQWQKSLESHLEQRENWLIQQLRAELQTMRQEQQRLMQEQQQFRQSLHGQTQHWDVQQQQHFSSNQAKLAQIAEAARALAESAATLSTPAPFEPFPPLP